jgi:hypothetical protein
MRSKLTAISFAILSLLSLLFSGAQAQTSGGSTGTAPGMSMDPLGWAVSAKDRPDPLRDAKDMVTQETVGMRLRAEVWVRAEPCKTGGAVRNCPKSLDTQGRFFIGPLWHDVPLGTVQVEELWLTWRDRHGTAQSWHTRELVRSDDHRFAFVGAPSLPQGTPVDVIVRLRGVADLLQVRYRTAYLRGS